MIPLDTATLKKFIKLAGDNLRGGWILIGGTVLPLLGIDHRVTLDIDLIPLGKRGNEVTLELMQLAEKVGLAIESINSAGLYFLEKIPKYSEQMILLHQGKSAKIYRPHVNLFLQLKIKRLTESDLMDCLEMIKFSKKHDEEIERDLIKTLLEKEMKGLSADQGRLDRLNTLLTFFSKRT